LQDELDLVLPDRPPQLVKISIRDNQSSYTQRVEVQCTFLSTRARVCGGALHLSRLLFSRAQEDTTVWEVVHKITRKIADSAQHPLVRPTRARPFICILYFFYLYLYFFLFLLLAISQRTVVGAMQDEYALFTADGKSLREDDLLATHAPSIAVLSLSLFRLTFVSFTCDRSCMEPPVLVPDRGPVCRRN
jgi:hypothetical protein